MSVSGARARPSTSISTISRSGCAPPARRRPASRIRWPNLRGWSRRRGRRRAAARPRRRAAARRRRRRRRPSPPPQPPSRDSRRRSRPPHCGPRSTTPRSSAELDAASEDSEARDARRGAPLRSYPASRAGVARSRAGRVAGSGRFPRLAIAGVAMIGAVFALKGGLPGMPKAPPFIAAADGPTKVQPPSDATVSTPTDAGANLLKDNTQASRSRSSTTRSSRSI